jgi:hypothetical protein
LEFKTNHIKTGDYVICFYDTYGNKANDKLPSESYTEAIRLGNEVLNEYERVDSFTIDRRVYNSKDAHEAF